MKIEDLTTEVRPRSAWESIDLGLRMVQTWSKPILLSWLIFVLPLCIVIYTFLYQHPVWSVVVIWWLKPLFDRIPLYIVSHSVFGDIPSVRDIRKVLPSIIKPHLIKSLLWYRFDLARSFNLPIWQLEGLKGSARSKRVKILQKEVYGSAVALTFFCVFIQFILWVACYALFFMLLPSNVALSEISLFTFNDESIVPGLLLNLFAFISLSIIEPFYVAGGFALYLNRRTHLEAWDIELKFRSLVKRFKTTHNRTKATKSNTTKILSVLLLVLVIGNSNVNIITPAQAETSKVHYSELSNAQASDIIKKVMATDEFNTKVKTKSWQLKDGALKDFFNKKDKDDKKDKDSSAFEFLSALLSAIIGNILYVLLGIAVFVLLVYLGFKLIKYLPESNFSFFKKNKTEEKLESIFGLDLAPESLPDDVGTQAWLLWQGEQFIAALSLLYRGSLSKLVNQNGVKLPYSATEGDCIRILKNSHIKENQALINYFEVLTLMWQRAAYAHQLPELLAVKKICESWPGIFQHDVVS